MHFLAEKKKATKQNKQVPRHSSVDTSTRFLCPHLVNSSSFLFSAVFVVTFAIYICSYRPAPGDSLLTPSQYAARRRGGRRQYGRPSTLCYRYSQYGPAGCNCCKSCHVKRSIPVAVRIKAHPYHVFRKAVRTR